MRSWIVAFCLIGAVQANAQTEFPSFLRAHRFTIKAGVSYSNIYKTRGQQLVADAKSGFVGGLGCLIPLGPLIGLQPEVLYSQKGFRGKGTVLDGAYEVKRTTHYLDLPFLLVVKPDQYFSVLLGPQVSYLLRQRDHFTQPLTLPQANEFAADSQRRLVFGYVIGLDINVERFVIGVRAGWDMQSNKTRPVSSTPSYQNTWFQSSFGWRF